MLRYWARGIRFVAFVLLSTSSFAQPPDTLWTHIFAEAGQDLRCLDAVAMPNGHTVLAGEYSGDGYVVWLDTEGNVTRSRIYEQSPFFSRFQSSASALDSGLTLAGTTAGPYSGLIHIGSSGDTLWTKIYPSVRNTWPKELCATSDGGYAFVADFQSLFITIVRTDSVGDTIWTREYFRFPGVRISSSIAQTTDEGFVIGGSVATENGFDYFILRTSHNGDSLWTTIIGGPETDLLEDVIVTSDGGFLACGSFERSDETSDCYIVKLDRFGSPQWSSYYGGDSHDWIKEAVELPNGTFILAGTSSSFGNGSSDFFELCIDSLGDSIWAVTVGTPQMDILETLCILEDGEQLLAGRTSDDNWGIYAVRLSRTTSTGQNSYRKRAKPEKVLCAYPNPCNSITTIQYSMAKPGEVSISLVNTLGQHVYTYKQVEQAGDHSLSVDVTRLSSGTYFVHLLASDFQLTRPLTIIK